VAIVSGQIQFLAVFYSPQALPEPIKALEIGGQKGSQNFHSDPYGIHDLSDIREHFLSIVAFHGIDQSYLFPITRYAL